MAKGLKPALNFDERAPVVSSIASDIEVAFDENDDAWLDEELSAEELAALGEEDFEDEEALEEELRFLEEAEARRRATLMAVENANAENVVALENLGPNTEKLVEETVEPIVKSAPPQTFEEADEGYADAVDDYEPSYDEDFEGEAFSGANLAAPSIAGEPGASDRGHLAVEQAGGVAPKAAGAGLSAFRGDLITDEDADGDVGDYGDEASEQFFVPRIAIHAFCETPHVTTLLENASIDRRLSKAHVSMHMGGIDKAVDFYKSNSTPNLIIVETVEDGAGLFGKLGRLAEVCDPATKVIIIGRINDIGLFRELMNQGISDYVVRPKSPLKIIKSIANLYVDPTAAPIGRTVAFFGARGGVGSSTIAHNVAWCAAEELESDTVILDLDLAFGTASLDFEQDPTSGLLEALSSPERLDDVLLDRLLQKHTERLSLLTAPNLLDRDYELRNEAFETVLDVVRGAAPTIVVDVPHLWTAWSRRVLQTADEIVVTTTPDLASFRNTKNLIDVVASARPNDAPPLLVLNQYDAKTSSVQAEQFVEHVGVTPALVLGWEPQLFQAAATNAAPVLEIAGKSKTAIGLRELSARVLGREEVSQRKSTFSLPKLFKR